jgi:hypothetical protein
MQHKLIMENWRNFVNTPQEQFLIYERAGALQRIDFDNLLKEIDTGKTSHEDAYLIFERAFEYGHRRLLEEGILDLVMKGYNKAGEILSNIGEDVKAAWKKVNDFYLDMVLKAINLASRGIAAFVKYANKIFSAIERFKEKHPILYKFIIAIMFAVIIYSLFGSSNAQAAVKVGNVQIDDTTYQAMQGALNEAGRGSPDIAMAVGKAQVALERAHQAKEAVDIQTLGPIVDEALSQTVQLMGQVKSDEPGALQLFAKWIKVGESLRFSATGF